MWPFTKKNINSFSTFEELAEYNTRRSKGIVHDKDYVARMKKLQEAYSGPF